MIVGGGGPEPELAEFRTVNTGSRVTWLWMVVLAVGGFMLGGRE